MLAQKLTQTHINHLAGQPVAQLFAQDTRAPNPCGFHHVPKAHAPMRTLTAAADAAHC
jgi:hypothetical protein